LKLLFPFPAVATWNKEEAIKSAEKVRLLDINLLATGHGKWIENPSRQIEALLRNHKRR